MHKNKSSQPRYLYNERYDTAKITLPKRNMNIWLNELLTLPAKAFFAGFLS